MDLLYSFSLVLNFIVIGVGWFIKSRCEKEPFIKQKLNGFLQALFYDGEG